MKLIVASDSFKGSLSAAELCTCVQRAAQRVFPQWEILSLPVADGGEGTVDSICAALSGSMQSVTVQNPLGEPVNASYAIFNGGSSAALEMAAASGLPLIAPEARDVLRSNTYGTGEMMLDALQKGCTELYIGIGGSATNDGGLGAGLLAFTGAKMQSGVDTVLELLHFDKVLEDADLVITGEGRMDYQSACGKVAYGVGMRCKAAGVPCIALVGGMGERAEEMYQYGINSIMTTVNGIIPLTDALENAAALCEGAAERALRMVRIGMQM